QLAVELMNAFSEFSGGGRLGVGAIAAGAVGHDLVSQDIEHAAETWASIQRDGQRKYVFAKMGACVGEHAIERSVGFIERVDDDHSRKTVERGVVPHGIGSHAE